MGQLSAVWSRMICTAVCALLCLAANAASFFEQGNELFEKRRYPEAIQSYQAALTNGVVAPEVYFNLGNAYFRNGEVGRALLQYRRAERLSPRDPDIQANLRFARDSISGNGSIQQSPFTRFLTYFRLDEITWIAAAAFWIWAALVAATLLKPKLKPNLRGLIRVACATFLAAAGWLSLSLYAAKQPTAIVVDREAVARLGPLVDSQTAFTAPEGSELSVIGRREGWVHVRDRASRTGWVQSRQVALFPDEHSF